MPGFFDKLKHGAEKAAFEADRLRRLNQAQSDLRALHRQLGAQTAAMGQQALALYDSGSLTQPELLATCEQIDRLREQMAEQETIIQQIREEKPPEAPVPASHGHICPRCQIELPADAGFCPRCGSPAAGVVPPPPPPPPPPPVARTCSQCGTGLAAEALFCPTCGASVDAGAVAQDVVAPAPLGLVEPEAPVPLKAEAGQIVCHHCQALIPDEAIFCPECGKLAAPAPEEVADADELPTPEESPLPPEPPAQDAAPAGEEASSPSEELDEEIPPALDEAAPAMEEDLPARDESPSGTVCSSCGASIPSEADFCPDCGAPVEPAQAEAD